MLDGPQLLKPCTLRERTVLPSAGGRGHCRGNTLTCGDSAWTPGPFIRENRTRCRLSSSSRETTRSAATMFKSAPSLLSSPRPQFISPEISGSFLWVGWWGVSISHSFERRDGSVTGLTATTACLHLFSLP